MEVTRSWHGILSTIIKRNEEERVKANGNHIEKAIVE